MYRDLKSFIRHMTYTNEFKLMREYISNRNKILEALPKDSTKAKDALEQLKIHYAKLVKNQRLRMK